MSEFPTQRARPVWIASYPRSGNTFLRIILESVFRLPSYSLYYVDGESHRDPSAEALEQAPRLPRNWRDAIIKTENAPPILIKTHDPPADAAPAIFIVRDGRATIDSYFHYHKKYAFEQPSLTEIIAGACQFGSWSDHYRAWRPKTRPDTLMLRYEELVSQPEETISRLAGFLKLKPRETRLPAFEELQKRLPQFFRRGQNADYLQEWSPAHLALFNELHGGAMQDLGFPIVPSSVSAVESVKELAQSAARSHHAYLQQLATHGESLANHQHELRQLSGRIQDLSKEIELVLKPLLQTNWVRLGVALRAQPGLADQTSHPPASQPLPPLARKSSTPSPGQIF